MAIDASIVGGLKQFQPESPMDNYGKMMTLQSLMQKGQLDQISLQQHQQAQAEDAQMRGYVTQSGGDMNKLRELTYNGGLYKQGQAQDKAIADQAEAQAKAAHLDAQTGKLQSETLNLAISRHKEQLNNVNSYEGAVNWVRQGYSDPSMTAVTRGGNLEQSLSEIPQDPAGFEKWKMQSGLSADQLLKMTKPDANAVLSAKTATGNNAATVGATTRGQDMTAGTASAKLGQDASQFSQTAAAKLAEGKPLTESQGNATNFAARMTQSTLILAHFHALQSRRLDWHHAQPAPSCRLQIPP